MNLKHWVLGLIAACAFAIPAQAQHHGHHGGGGGWGGGGYHHPHYPGGGWGGGGYYHHHHYPHYYSSYYGGYGQNYYQQGVVSGQRYMVPAGYEGTPAGNIINYGGYNYVANGDETMTLSQ